MKAKKSSPPLRETKRIVLSDAEILACINMMRLASDEFDEIEEGAGVPRGTLEALEARMLAKPREKTKK